MVCGPGYLGDGRMVGSRPTSPMEPIVDQPQELETAIERVEQTARLLDAVRSGDAEAREELLRRYLPILSRWTHGRLPGDSRFLSDTSDLVQITLVRALNHVDEFRSRREGAFLAFLRQIVLNAIRDEIRRAQVRRSEDIEDHELASADVPALQGAVESETMEHYERALAELPERAREAIIMRIEFGFSYPEIAAATASPSANAARMMVSRALVQLAEVLEDRR